MKIQVLTVVSWLVWGAAAVAGPVEDKAAVQQAMQSIQGRGIRAHMRFLSDSLLEGRAPGTRGR